MKYFVFDVESIGLHGEGFAVGGFVINEKFECEREFCFCCPPEACQGHADDRAWVMANVPTMALTHGDAIGLREAFWKEWLTAKAEGAVMAADCLWPVEARFVRDCVAERPMARAADGPYPFIEIGTMLHAAGMDPIGTYRRQGNELPVHHPLNDARQSGRLLKEALIRLEDSRW